MTMTLTALTPAATTALHPEQTAQTDAKLHQAAQQFYAMFLGEMLRLTRPESKAAGAFAEGQGEKSWQVFMDQALGQAATAHGGTGLEAAIEKALRTAQGMPAKKTPQ
jgi:Rod binding domain-containing protein